MKTLFNIFLFSVVLSASALAGVPTISHVEVTDVAPGSFAVTWTASEASTATLSLFASDCTSTITGYSLVSEGSDTTGNMKVTAVGLSADTTYCYQTSTTSKNTSDTTPYPQEPATVTTARAVLRTMATGTVSVPFANDLLRAPSVYLPSETDAADGTLSVLYLDGGRGPMSLLFTDNEKARYFNMNNLFSSATGSTMNLVGGERVRISERHGKSGCVIDRFRKIPADNETTRARAFTASPRPQDIDYNGTVNILDVLRVAGGMGTEKGEPCFNSELDMSSHDRVDQADLDSVIGSFDAKP